MTRLSPARSVAFDVLEQVAEGAYASDVLRQLSVSLSARDAGLSLQIVFGCLRFQAQLDYLIEQYSGRRPNKLDRAVLLALRTAVFQLRYLERIPAHAAVHDSVELVKRRARSAAGFVNAVLRKVNRDPVQWPDLATELSVPKWLLERWTKHFGREQARQIAEAALHEPEQYIRVPSGSELPQNLNLEPAGPQGAYRLLSSAGREVRLHDIGSQSIVPLLDLQPGHSFLDLCAAPGNKTLQALETSLSLAIACDVSWVRLREVPAACPRVVLDATQPLPFNRQFDRVFIDAPCSGTGTLGRNPEIKWRVQNGDFDRFGEKQAQILRQGAERLSPNGTLVYATCSLETEENESVIQRILETDTGLRLTREVWRLPGSDEGDGFYAAVLKKAAN